MSKDEERMEASRFVAAQSGVVQGEYGQSRLLIGCVGALVFLYLRGFLLKGAPLAALGDEGLFLGRAVHVLHGHVLYRDVFEMVTPGTELLFAAVFRVFGVHAWVIQACGVAVGLAIFAVMTWVAEKIVRGWAAVLPGAMFLVFGLSNAYDITHHWLSTLAALTATGVLMGGTSRWRLAGAGVLCGAAVLFTQTSGALGFAGLLGYLVWVGRAEKRMTPVVWPFVLPFAAVVAGVLGYYAYMAGLGRLFFDVVVFAPRYLSGEVNSVRTYLRHLPRAHGGSDALRLFEYLVVYALVPYVYVAGIYRLGGGRALEYEERRRVVLLHVVGLALFLGVVSGPRFFRLCTVSPPAMVVCVWLMSGEARWMRTGRGALAVVTAMLAVVLCVHRQTQWSGVLDLPVGRTAFVDRQEYERFRWLAERTKPGEAFFNDAGLSLYLGLKTPAAAEFVNEDAFSRPEQVDAIVHWLEDEPAHYIAMYPKATGAAASESQSGPLREYVGAHYHLARRFYPADGVGYEEMWERN